MIRPTMGAGVILGLFLSLSGFSAEKQPRKMSSFNKIEGTVLQVGRAPFVRPAIVSPTNQRVTFSPTKLGAELQKWVSFSLRVIYQVQGGENHVVAYQAIKAASGEKPLIGKLVKQGDDLIFVDEQATGPYFIVAVKTAQLGELVHRARVVIVPAKIKNDGLQSQLWISAFFVLN